MIEVLLYNLEKTEQEIFYFSEISTLEVTTLLDDATKIKNARIFAYDKGGYLGEDVYGTFKTIGEFNRFFVNNRKYFLHDCELSLEDDMKIGSHDDGEVHINMPIDYKKRTLIKGVFRMKGLSVTLLEEIMKMPGYYFSINADGRIESIHKTFDDYLNRDK